MTSPLLAMKVALACDVDTGSEVHSGVSETCRFLEGIIGQCRLFGGRETLGESAAFLVNLLIKGIVGIRVSC
jgi:hypothetical protein